MTGQPTEQCVQIALVQATEAPGRGGGPAAALRTLSSNNVPSVAMPPVARPERRRNVRRSRMSLACGVTAAAIVVRCAEDAFFLISTDDLFHKRRPCSRCCCVRFPCSGILNGDPLPPRPPRQPSQRQRS